MMSILNFLKKIFVKNNIQVAKSESITDNAIYSEKQAKADNETQILSIWDIIKCTEHTQAYHLVSVIPYDEWIDMNEIMRRIWDLFQIEYKNDRSLYPYLKTMVDLGLIETSNIGGKRKWRKKDLLVKMNQNKAEKEIISLDNLVKAQQNKQINQ